MGFDCCLQTHLGASAPGSFSFIPPSNKIVIVVHENFTSAVGCSYSFTVSRADATGGCQVNGVPNQECVGTAGTDVILGTSRKDVIFGRGGDDYIVGFQKADLLCGGPGAVRLRIGIAS